MGKDISIKKAVCCSEVGQIGGMAKTVSKDHHPNELNHRRSFVPNNTSFVGLTGIWISFVSVVRLLTLALSLTPFQW